MGRYLVQVVETEVNKTKNGDGLYMKAVMEVQDGHNQGRKWFENYNLRNPSEIAERIGLQALEKLKVAVGVGGQKMRNTGIVEFKPFYIDVADRLNKRSGEMERVIKAYEPYGSPVTNGQQRQQVGYSQQAAQQPQQHHQQQAAPQQADVPGRAGGRPWGNRR